MNVPHVFNDDFVIHAEPTHPGCLEMEAFHKEGSWWDPAHPGCLEMEAFHKQGSWWDPAVCSSHRQILGNGLVLLLRSMQMLLVETTFGSLLKGLKLW